MRGVLLFLACLTWMFSGVTLANTMSNPQIAHLEHETDAQLVLTHIRSSKELKKHLPMFMQEATDAISSHQGAIPSALALKTAVSIQKAPRIRNDLFKQALKHRSALYRIDNQLSDHEQITEIIIAMSAAITLYENHETMRDAFQDQALLRHKLNEAYPELGVKAGFYESSLNRANKYEYRKEMADAIAFFNDNQAVIHQHIAVSSPTIKALTHHISNSQLLKTYQGSHIIRAFLTLPKKVGHSVGALPKKGLQKLKFNSSKVVGNTLGLVRWREGKLKDNAALTEALAAQLQPGDILLEKTPFALTDKTIPGHFGHAAMYTGSTKQLKQLGANIFPSILKGWNQMESGANVLEALRGGVQLNTLSAFMNIDDIAVLRQKNITPDQQVNVVSIALDNLGKQYDFNFDVNTTETIVCSELVYMAYPDIDFVTKRVLNSYTISPDDIAQQAGQGTKYPLELVMFAHNGQLILDQNTNKGAHALYESLVRPPKGPSAREQASSIFTGFTKKLTHD